MIYFILAAAAYVFLSKPAEAQAVTLDAPSSSSKPVEAHFSPILAPTKTAIIPTRFTEQVLQAASVPPGTRIDRLSTLGNRNA